MEYLRPESIEEALALLDDGIPLAGGSHITPKRYDIGRVVDLQSLGLDELALREGTFTAGAMVRLQQLMAPELALPEALRKACRHEAAWNIRNQATLGGVLWSADGRSPLLTALAALEPVVEIAPDDQQQVLSAYLEERGTGVHLILSITLEVPQAMAYDYVARAPMDRPLVCVAGSCHRSDSGNILRMALGGYGDAPVALSFEFDASDDDLLDRVSQATRDAYRSAQDAFASAEYRSDVAGVLGRRVASEVVAGC